eukprot:scaffold6247_cov256-Pinguiococcus_pyrenoidosus.AAC.3
MWTAEQTLNAIRRRQDLRWRLLHRALRWLLPACHTAGRHGRAAGEGLADGSRQRRERHVAQHPARAEVRLGPRLGGDPLV